MAAFITNIPYIQLFDNNGTTPLAGGMIYTYATGTTTPLVTYTDPAGTIPASNPIILDSAGRAQIYASGSYRFKVTNSAGVPVGPNGGITDGITLQNTSGVMSKSIYDPANVNEQLVGLTATQVITNKTINGNSILGPVLGTVQTTVSGTSKDFTGIPSGCKRIDITFNVVSTSGTNYPLIQIGPAAGIETTGYSSNAYFINPTSTYGGITSTSGYIIASSVAGNLITGTITLLLHDTSNIWVCSHSLGYPAGPLLFAGSGGKAIAGPITQLRITTVGGTDTFDNGSINVQYS